MNIKKIILIAFSFVLAFESFALSGDELVGKEVVELMPNGCLYAPDKNDNMKWSKNIDAGTVFTVTGTKVATRITSKGSEPDTAFYKVKAGRVEGYIPQSWVYEKVGALAVITADCAVYKSTRPSDVYTYAFKAGKPVILTGKQQTFSKALPWQFVEVVYFDRASSWKIKTAWVSSDRISSEKDDIVAFSLMDKAAVEKNETIRNEFFANIDGLKLSPAVEARYLEIRSGFEKPTFEKRESYGGYMTVTAGEENGNINYRSEPGQESVVRGRFTERSTVFIDERTVEVEKIGDEEESWYHFILDENTSSDAAIELNTEAPEDEQIREGWIFGAYIQ